MLTHHLCLRWDYFVASALRKIEWKYPETTWGTDELFNTSLLQSDFINGISICAKGAVRGEDHSGSAHLWRWRRSSMETHYIGVYAPAKLLETDESPVSFTNVAALTLLMLVLLKSHTSKTCRRKMEGSMESCSRLFSVCFNQIFV